MRISLDALSVRMLIFAAAVAYAVTGTVWHEDVQDFVRLMQREPQWLWLMTTIAGAALVVLMWSIADRRMRRRGGETGGWRSGWMALVVAAAAGYVLLMSYPTEVVHYLQYGILAVVLAFATRRIDMSFVLTASAGILDEAYQYWWLHRNWGVYYDFNDVLLNVIAAGLGLAVMVELQPGLFLEKSLRAETQRRQRTRREDENVEESMSSSSLAPMHNHSPGFDLERSLHAETQRTQRTQREELIDVSDQEVHKSYSANSALSATLRETSFQFALLLLALFAFGVWTGLIALQTADVRDHTLLLLNRMPPLETFWDTWGGTTKPHHIVRAWPGVVLTGLLTVAGTRLVRSVIYKVR